MKKKSKEKTFTDDEKLKEYRKFSGEEKLRWLHEFNEFTRRFQTKRAAKLRATRQGA